MHYFFWCFLSLCVSFLPAPFLSAIQSMCGLYQSSKWGVFKCIGAYNYFFLLSCTNASLYPLHLLSQLFRACEACIKGSKWGVLICIGAYTLIFLLFLILVCLPPPPLVSAVQGMRCRFYVKVSGVVLKCIGSYTLLLFLFFCCFFVLMGLSSLLSQLSKASVAYIKVSKWGCLEMQLS